MSDTLQALSPTRQEILAWIKSAGGATTADIAGRLGITDEGARQHLVFLEKHGWVERQTKRSDAPRLGRPTASYTITEKGEAFFPKRYDQLAIALIDTVVARYGVEALREALSAIVDRQVEEWEPRLEGMTIDQRLDALRDFYLENDPFTTVERNGGVKLVERNCPYQRVAMERPALCSTTVSTLTRLLGFRVERRSKCQNGDGRCAFHGLANEPVDTKTFRFDFERNGEGED